MFLQASYNKLVSNHLMIAFISRSSHQLATVKEVCAYPPITDMSIEGQRRHRRQMWYDSIKTLPTVEQKLYELALFSRPTQRRFLITACPPSYSGIDFQKYITRTHLINHLPENIMKINVDKELDEIEDAFKETLSSYCFNNWNCQDENYAHLYFKKSNCSKLMNILISHCYKKLGLKNDYILESTIQQYPRLESYWLHGGFESAKNKLYQKNLVFQFKEVPDFIIRIRKPLNPILSLEDPLCSTAEVPNYHYHPMILGYHFDHKRTTFVPGHWFDDPCEYPFLLFYSSDNLNYFLKNLQNYDISKIKDNVGIIMSFGWLNAAATYQGFTPYHDLTYPLVSQAVVSNGQNWNFYVYQLNTITFHEDVDNKNRRNICWSSGEMRLFDTIENGRIKGFNKEVFRILLKFLLNAPVPQENVVLKPYLGTDNRTEEEIRNMRYFYRRMYSQAPKHDVHKYEIPTWQRIYVYSKVAKPMPFVKMF